MSMSIRVVLGALLVLALTSSALAETKVEVKGEAKSRIAAPDATVKVTAEGIAAWNRDGKTIVLRDLDAPDNPYVKSYTEWDRWVIQNARPDIRFTDLRWVDGRWVYTDGGKDVAVTVARVDPKGYLIPGLDSRVVTVGPNPVVLPRANDDHYYVIAVGEPEPAVRRVYTSGRVKAMAPAAPRVPDWLIREPADRVVFLPKEEVVVQRSNVWIRYDAKGKVIAKSEPGVSWRTLYWPKFSDVIREANAQKWAVLEDSGYVVVRDSAGNIKTVYDYDGTPVKIEEVKVDRDPYIYTPLEWELIEPLRDAQVSVDVDGADVDVTVEK
jgi:hypothetical protein